MWSCLGVCDLPCRDLCAHCCLGCLHSSPWYPCTACPQEDIAQLTRRGKTAAARDTQWQQHRVFFCTPQILSNDLKTGVCPAEEVVCLVLDECHKAVGDSDYVKAARALFDRRVKFRLLALSATPGSSFNKIQVTGGTMQVPGVSALLVAPDYAVWTRTREGHVSPSSSAIPSPRIH